VKLIVDTTGPTDQLELDIDTMLEDALDADALFAKVLARICQYVIRNEQSLDSLYVVQLDGDEETGLDVPDDDGVDFTHLKEACQLFWYLSEKDRWIDEGRVFAKVNDHWQYTNFDDIKSEVEDDYHSQYEDCDGPEAFAKQYMEDVCDDLPEHYRSYFDYEAYGEALIQDFEQYEWNGTTYLYSR
jgi:hypothetical protein